MKIDNQKFEIAIANACMTFSDLSKKSGISLFTISRMQGDVKIRPETIGKIAKALNVKVEELIETTAATVNQNTRNSESN
ncbi:MAG: helix-turn-helix transcriptional regulator [Clostridia bacterium]|nr:helix-turn-helix transcriptional regulator [Clostridia bacterium]